MNYEEAYAYIEECGKSGTVLGLESIRLLAEELGNPQDQLKFVHIAGTNAKGSVLAYVSTVLKQAGLRVGRYSSPGVFQYLERFWINGRNMSRKEFADYMERIREACQCMTKKGFPHPTAFEMETALAFLYFYEKKCDLVVLECGMGGDMDATNLIRTPLVCILTKISRDHMSYLGNSIREIARHKCGIVKENIPVITMMQEDKVMDVIRKTCQKKHAPLIVADPLELSNIHRNMEKQTFEINKQIYTIRLLGICQIENAYAALKALWTLRGEETMIDDREEKNIISISDRAILRGLEETVWKGRFTILGKRPYFVLDGAHNEDAALRLMESVQFYFTNRRIIYIMGMLKDKDYDKVIAITANRADQIITVTAPDNPRAMSAYELAKAVEKVNPNVTSSDSIEEAIEMAYLFSDRNSVILAFGSLSFLGSLTAIVNKGGMIRSDTHGKQRKD